MERQDILEIFKMDKEHKVRQLRKEIAMLRSILARVENDLDSDKVYASNGLQGNEWRLYTDLADLERLNSAIKYIEGMDD